MEEQLSQKIQEVLNDPAQMAQVLELAKSLGVTLPPPDAPAGSPPEEKAPPDTPPAPPVPNPPPMGGLAQRQEALLRALEPFLRPARREKIERALQIARLSGIAGSALRRGGPGTRDAR